MKSGAWSDPDFNGAPTYDTTRPHRRDRHERAERPRGARRRRWRSTAGYHNLTLLPGRHRARERRGVQLGRQRHLRMLSCPAEIWNPDTETWTTVDSLQNGRLYHSTALLLPDGRVLMAGGGQLPGSIAVDQTNAEIYSPPYLFKGARPTISSAPATASYGSSFDVTTPNAAPDRQGLADPVALRDARVRPEPAVPVPELHRRCRQGDRSGSGEREPGAARRLHALPRRHERRSIGRLVRPRRRLPPTRSHRPRRPT